MLTAVRRWWEARAAVGQLLRSQARERAAFAFLVHEKLDEAAACIEGGDAARAARLWEEAFAADPVVARSSPRTVHVLIGIGRPEEAEAVMAEGMRRHPAEPLFDAATDALAVLGRAQPPDGLPNWGPAEMTAATAATFLDWWWPAMFGAPPGPPVRAAFTAAMAELLAPLQAQPAGLVHRDYWAGNLFWLPRNRAPCRVAIIDFQDAAIGAPAYDLVSLVQDARRDLPDDLADRQIARLLAARPELDRPSFEAAFAICAAQRHLRVAALWVRLARRDAKPGYLVHGPRCWRLLDRALRHPATAPLRSFLDQHVPPALRRNPDQRAA